MAIWLLLPAALFSYLAYDAWRISSPSQDVPYELEAKERGESVAGLPVSEQLKRREWHRRYGVGQTSDIVWLWAILAAACLAGAALGMLT
jgi:hypothetical protein